MSVKIDGTSIEKLGDNVRGLNFRLRVQAKASSYTVVEADCGSVFTTRGAAGAITFTLPAVSSTYTDFVCWFFNAVDQNMTIAGTAGELMTFNDVAANSVAFSTSSEKVGAGVMAVCDGTSWLILPMTEETQTMTVAT